MILRRKQLCNRVHYGKYDDDYDVNVFRGGESFNIFPSSVKAENLINHAINMSVIRLRMLSIACAISKPPPCLRHNYQVKLLIAQRHIIIIARPSAKAAQANCFKYRTHVKK